MIDGRCRRGHRVCKRDFAPESRFSPSSGNRGLRISITPCPRSLSDLGRIGCKMTWPVHTGRQSHELDQRTGDTAARCSVENCNQMKIPPKLPEPAERGPPAQAPGWPQNTVIPLTITPYPTSRSTARWPHASQDSRHLDLTGIACGLAQAQYILNAMLGSAESAPNRRHRPDARIAQD